MIWFLTSKFYGEYPDSFLPSEAPIEEDTVYNCSYAKLIYNFGKIGLETIIDDETCSFSVLTNKKYCYPGDIVYHSIHYSDGTIHSKQIKEYIHGKWENEIESEYKRRLSENK